MYQVISMVINISVYRDLIKFAYQKYFLLSPSIRFLPTDFDDNTPYGHSAVRFINSKHTAIDCSATVGKMVGGNHLNFRFDRPDGETACGGLLADLNSRGYGLFLHELVHILGIFSLAQFICYVGYNFLNMH
jgi:hypothetical protein